jgi:phosphoribosylaminoimidazolecarboxamide formyltransferase / IMP cyclohydrolase
MTNKIQRALISCTNKSGLEELGQFLHKNGVEILSTGGTAKLLRDCNIPVIDVSDFTGSPEILDGRLKTLHPKVHGGILAIRANESHQKQMAANDLKPIDLVIVNLYEFENTIAKEGCTLAQAIENIDIGGPTMLRAAAKNYKDVAVVIDPTDYAGLMEEIKTNSTISQDTRFKLAVKVFNQTAKYDTAISSYLNLQSANDNQPVFSEDSSVQISKVQDLRYGENPHQKAALYKEAGATSGIINAKQWQGKELSFNNILDLESAYQCCREFQDPSCVIVKHLNPCGTATAEKLSEAFLRARSGDPVSCFGGIVALNQKVDKQTALLMAETFFEGIIAPDYDEDALEVFKGKKNLRIMSLSNFDNRQGDLDYRRVEGGFLVQDADNECVDLASCEVVTDRKPTEQELKDLNFAWKIVKHVKSNAIVFAKDAQSVGVGAGQMSRVDSVKIAARKAVESFKDESILQGAVMASDAFFPFRDGVDAAAKTGIKAIVQPGGSVRDKEVIEACNENGITMICTKMRHFRH